MNELTWQTYEELVKDIYQALGHARGVAIECWGRTCRVQGNSGVQYQIDVLTSHSDGIHQYRTAISCKYWQEKVGQPEVSSWIQTVEDIGANKGIIVSKMGFTKPALTLASANGIDLVELRRPLDQDWKGYIREIGFRIVMEMPRVHNVEIKLAAKAPDEKARHEQQANAQRIFIEDRDRQTRRSMATIMEEAIRDAPNEEQHTLTFSPGSVLVYADEPDRPGNESAIESLGFQVTHETVETESTIRADDYVYMVMEAVFEGRSWVIANSGQIMPRESSDPA